jgi:lipocalin
MMRSIDCCKRTALGRFLWILARQPCLPPEVLADLKAQARCLGFDVASLVTTLR